MLLKPANMHLVLHLLVHSFDLAKVDLAHCGKKKSQLADVGYEAQATWKATDRELYTLELFRIGSSYWEPIVKFSRWHSSSM